VEHEKDEDQGVGHAREAELPIGPDEQQAEPEDERVLRDPGAARDRRDGEQGELDCEHRDEHQHELAVLAARTRRAHRAALLRALARM
jgi:hypothetical protein